MAAGLQEGKASVAQLLQGPPVERRTGPGDLLVRRTGFRQGFGETQKIGGDWGEGGSLQAPDRGGGPVAKRLFQQRQIDQPFAGVIQKFQAKVAGREHAARDAGGQRKDGDGIGALRPGRRIGGQFCQMARLVEARGVAGAGGCEGEPACHQRGRNGGEEGGFAGAGQAGDADADGGGGEWPEAAGERDGSADEVVQNGHMQALRPWELWLQIVAQIVREPMTRGFTQPEARAGATEDADGRPEQRQRYRRTTKCRLLVVRASAVTSGIPPP